LADIPEMAGPPCAAPSDVWLRLVKVGREQASSAACSLAAPIPLVQPTMTMFGFSTVILTPPYVSVCAEAPTVQTTVAITAGGICMSSAI
jgi:hypothetical protein